jgi:hypothetical protein
LLDARIKQTLRSSSVHRWLERGQLESAASAFRLRLGCAEVRGSPESEAAGVS